MLQLHHSQQFLTSLSRTFLPDVHLTTLDGEGRVVSGHKHILATVSSKLESLFLRSEGEVGPVMVRNIGFQELEKIVDFIYTGNLIVETEQDEEDVWDGLYILRMVDGEMGIIYRTADSQDGGEIEKRSRDPRKVLKKNVQVKIESISRSNVCIDAESDRIEETDTSATAIVELKEIEEIQKPTEKRSRSSLADYSESYLDILSSVEMTLPKLYKCEECSYSSAYKGNLKKHQQKKHIFVQQTGNRYHPSKERKLSASENIKRVTEVPAEEMDESTMKKVGFECSVCEKKCKDRKALASHQYRKHKELMEGQEVVCEVCDGTYKNNISLLIHQHRNHQQELEERMGANCHVLD